MGTNPIFYFILFLSSTPIPIYTKRIKEIWKEKKNKAKNFIPCETVIIVAVS